MVYFNLHASQINIYPTVMMVNIESAFSRWWPTRAIDFSALDRP
jgi:hypothetical protein